ncbi:DUF1569 domain-containing protein [candidate division KSB1 bacterium]|nr:DUF1569 domain-containing protein [candidate division KSB1 bacterium]
MIKKSLYESEVYQECLNRLEQIKPDSKPGWGKMTAAQMLSHCAEIVEVMNGKELKNIPFVAKLFKGIIRKMVLSEKPYPRNSGTHPQYEQESDRDFETEKKRAFDALDKFVNADIEVARQLKHPLFEEMTPEEKGWSMYKHLDHHLRQFGV